MKPTEDLRGVGLLILAFAAVCGYGPANGFCVFGAGIVLDCWIVELTRALKR